MSEYDRLRGQRERMKAAEERKPYERGYMAAVEAAAKVAEEMDEPCEFSANYPTPGQVAKRIRELKP